MRKYRKKPVVIEALQYKGDFDEVLAVCPDAFYHAEFDSLTIRTMEGTMKVSDGDFIIKGVKGEFYPCDAEIFELSYEEVPDESQ
jgi:hypothetical protein